VDEELRWPLVNAVYGAGCDTGVVLDVDAGLGDDVRHRWLLYLRCSDPIATAKSNAFQSMGGGRRHHDAAWPNNRNQPQMRSCQHDPWSSSALSNEFTPPRGRFLATSSLENRDHIRPGYEDLKTFVPSPRAIPRCGSSNCRLHGNFSNQDASITSSTRSFSLIRVTHHSAAAHRSLR
jgi:hypothetical protein